MENSIKHVVQVMSGKGGVGKTTLAVQLALGLERLGYRVGLLDADLCSPSVVAMLNIEDKSVYQSTEGWLPVYVGENKRLAVMSIGFFLSSKNDAVIWLGPKKTGMINQFLNGVCWGSLDYLIVDTPPGTSDEHLAVLHALEQFNLDGAVLVTSPQAASVADIRRQVNYCMKKNVKIIGIIENMSGFECQNCKEVTNIFSKGGGESLAEYFKIPYLGSIPISRLITKCYKNTASEATEDQLELPDSFNDIINKIVDCCTNHKEDTPQ